MNAKDRILTAPPLATLQPLEPIHDNTDDDESMDEEVGYGAGRKSNSEPLPAPAALSERPKDTEVAPGTPNSRSQSRT